MYGINYFWITSLRYAKNWDQRPPIDFWNSASQCSLLSISFLVPPIYVCTWAITCLEHPVLIIAQVWDFYWQTTCWFQLPTFDVGPARRCVSTDKTWQLSASDRWSFIALNKLTVDCVDMVCILAVEALLIIVSIDYRNTRITGDFLPFLWGRISPPFPIQNHTWTLPDNQRGSLKLALKFLLKHTTFYQNFKNLPHLN